MKQEIIFALSKERFGTPENGITTVSLQDFIKSMGDSLFASRREELETDQKFMQLVTYCVLYRLNDSGNREYFTYSRSKMSGEKRLMGNRSIGIGGHVELIDAMHQAEASFLHPDSEAFCVDLLSNAIARELDEEVTFTLDGEQEHPEPDFSQARNVGVIYDGENDVGRVHIGIVTAIQVGRSYVVTSNDAAVEAEGFHTAEELLDCDIPIENWTRIYLEAALEEERADSASTARDGAV